MRQVLLGLIAVALSIPTAAFAAGAKCPNVVIVLDKSGSMAQLPDDSDPPFCSSNSDCSSGKCYTGYGACMVSGAKMPIAHQVISDVLLGQNGAPKPSALVRFGFTDFPSDSSCGAGKVNPMLEPVNYGTEQDIASGVQNVDPGGSTPTAGTLSGLLNDPGMQESDRPRYVVLITDGEPNCTNNPDSDAVNAVTSLHNQGITTFVVGFGAGTAGSSTLDQMAAAGGGKYPDGGAITTAFQATDAASLSSALSGIIQAASQGELGGTGSCDPCLDVQCGSGQTCNSQTGQCETDPYAPCQSANCAAGQYCHVNAQGTAVCATACSGPCPSGEVCSDDGTCVANPCGSSGCNCGAGTVPDNSGNCVPNQCGKIQCPNGSFCSDNACAPLFASSTGNTTSGTTSGNTTGASGSSGSGTKNPNGNVTSSGGCASTNSAAFAGLALLALGMLGWRRRD